MRNIIILLLLAFLMGGCISFPPERKLTKEERKEKRARKKVAKLLKEFPEIIKSDSSSSSDTSTNYIHLEEIFYDSNRDQELQNWIDSVRYALAIKCPEYNDTIFIERIRTVISKKEIKPIEFDTAGVKVRVSGPPNKLRVNVILPLTTINNMKEKTTVVPCPECPVLGYWEALWRVKETIGGLVFLILLLIIYGLIRR